MRTAMMPAVSLLCLAMQARFACPHSRVDEWDEIRTAIRPCVDFVAQGYTEEQFLQLLSPAGKLGSAMEAHPHLRDFFLERAKLHQASRGIGGHERSTGWNVTRCPAFGRAIGEYLDREAPIFVAWQRAVGGEVSELADVKDVSPGSTESSILPRPGWAEMDEITPYRHEELACSWLGGNVKAALENLAWILQGEDGKDVQLPSIRNRIGARSEGIRQADRAMHEVLTRYWELLDDFRKTFLGAPEEGWGRTLNGLVWHGLQQREFADHGEFNKRAALFVPPAAGEARRRREQLLERVGRLQLTLRRNPEDASAQAELKQAEVDLRRLEDALGYVSGGRESVLRLKALYKPKPEITHPVRSAPIEVLKTLGSIDSDLRLWHTGHFTRLAKEIEDLGKAMDRLVAEGWQWSGTPVTSPGLSSWSTGGALYAQWWRLRFLRSEVWRGHPRTLEGLTYSFTANPGALEYVHPLLDRRLRGPRPEDGSIESSLINKTEDLFVRRVKVAPDYTEYLVEVPDVRMEGKPCECREELRKALWDSLGLENRGQKRSPEEEVGFWKVLRDELGKPGKDVLLFDACTGCPRVYDIRAQGKGAARPLPSLACRCAGVGPAGFSSGAFSPDLPILASDRIVQLFLLHQAGMTRYAWSFARAVSKEAKEKVKGSLANLLDSSSKEEGVAGPLASKSSEELEKEIDRAVEQAIGEDANLTQARKELEALEGKTGEYEKLKSARPLGAERRLEELQGRMLKDAKLARSELDFLDREVADDLWRRIKSANGSAEDAAEIVLGRQAGTIKQMVGARHVRTAAKQAEAVAEAAFAEKLLTLDLAQEASTHAADAERLVNEVAKDHATDAFWRKFARIKGEAGELAGRITALRGRTAGGKALAQRIEDARAALASLQTKIDDLMAKLQELGTALSKLKGPNWSHRWLQWLRDKRIPPGPTSAALTRAVTYGMILLDLCVIGPLSEYVAHGDLYYEKQQFRNKCLTVKNAVDREIHRYREFLGRLEDDPVSAKCWLQRNLPRGFGLLMARIAPIDRDSLGEWPDLAFLWNEKRKAVLGWRGFKVKAAESGELEFRPTDGDGSGGVAVMDPYLDLLARYRDRNDAWLRQTDRWLQREYRDRWRHLEKEGSSDWLLEWTEMSLESAKGGFFFLVWDLPSAIVRWMAEFGTSPLEGAADLWSRARDGLLIPAWEWSRSWVEPETLAGEHRARQSEEIQRETDASFVIVRNAFDQRRDD